MIKPEVLDAMVAAGCTAEQIAAAVKADFAMAEAEASERRAKAAAKKRRQRLSVPGTSGDMAGQEGTEGDIPSPKKETSPTPPKEKTTPSQSEANASSKTPRAALETVLDQQRAKDVVEMRQRIRKPLTTRGAELLAGQLAQWHDPNEAADEMVLNSWQGFKPEYLANRKARGSPSRQPAQRHDPFKALSQDLIDEQSSSSRGDRRNWDDAESIPLIAVEYQRR